MHVYRCVHMHDLVERFIRTWQCEAICKFLFAKGYQLASVDRLSASRIPGPGSDPYSCIAYSRRSQAVGMHAARGIHEAIILSAARQRNGSGGCFPAEVTKTEM